MRFIIYSLILANVAFYAWHVYNPGPAPQTGYHPPTFPAGVKTLVLLNERQQQGGETPTGNAGSKPSARPGDTTPSGAPGNPPSHSDTGQASPANNAASAAAAPAHSDTAAPSAPKSGKDGTPDGSATSPRRSPQGSSVRNDGPATDATAASGSTGNCYRIGPLSDAAAAAALSTRLAQQGLNATVDKVRTKQPDGYWVFLPPMSHDEAVGISEDLSSKGIKDYFIGKDNYISLGIFNGPQSAEQRRQQIADMGYAPKVEKHFTTQAQYWLAVKPDAGTTPSEAEWKALLSPVPAAQREPSSCE
ncbi:MAG: hypothetical protein P8124_13580 [Gammaproteobacteria bacterium]